MNIGIVVCFFSPQNYSLPRKHFAGTIDWLLRYNLPISVAQATLPGQAPQPIPKKCRSIVYPNCDYIFYKENLWNLGTQLLPDCDVFLFLDTDIRLTGNWLDIFKDVMEDADVCQPFHISRWLDKSGDLFQQRPNCASAIEDGQPLDLAKYHPGFGIGIHRDAFERLGGIYQYMLPGGGDSAFWSSFDRTKEGQRMRQYRAEKKMLNIRCPLYEEYRENALSLNLTVRACRPTKAIHKWHGHRKRRQYTTRELLFPRLENENPACYTRKDCLLMFSRPAPKAKQFWENRLEDGDE